MSAQKYVLFLPVENNSKMEQTHPEPANRNILLAVTMISSFFNPFLGAAVNVALPKIGEDFSLSAVGLSWIAMSFLMASAIFLVPFGKFSDRTGRKRMFLYGNLVVGATSLLCGLSTSGYMLIVARLLQGAGSAMIFASSMAIITAAFPQQVRGRMIGLNVSAVYLGLTAAPVVGGFLTESYGWQSLFFVSAAASLLVVVAILTKIRAEWIQAVNHRFDLMGALIYMISMAMLMYGFSKMPQLWAAGLTLGGLCGLVFFVFFELKSPDPVIDIALFVRNRIFAFANLAALINYAATFAVGFVMSLYLQYVHGLSPQQAGLLLIAQPAVMAIVASFAGRLSDKYDPRIPASAGMAVIAVGLAGFAFLEPHTSHPLIVANLMVLGFGFGLFSSPNTSAVMGAVARNQLGVASATISTMRLVGQMFSMATASMVIHLFLGNAVIEASNLSQFMQSARLLFVIFSVLCFLGVFASLARGKS